MWGTQVGEADKWSLKDKDALIDLLDKYIESEKKKETVFDAINIAIVTARAFIPLKYFETRC